MARTPLLFANSLGTDLRLWDCQADALADLSTVCRYDTRGHGQSDAPRGDYALDQLGRDLLTIADAASVSALVLSDFGVGPINAQEARYSVDSGGAR